MFEAWAVLVILRANGKGPKNIDTDCRSDA